MTAVAVAEATTVAVAEVTTVAVAVVEVVTTVAVAGTVAVAVVDVGVGWCMLMLVLSGAAIDGSGSGVEQGWS